QVMESKTPTPRRRYITVDGMLAVPAFSHAIRVGPHVYVSGTLGSVGTAAEPITGTFAQQARQALSNIQKILQTAGATMADVVKFNGYVTNIVDTAELHTIYGEFYPGNAPARATVGVAKLALDALIEIECHAIVEDVA